MRAVLAHGFLSGRNACAVDQAHQFAQRYCFVDHCLCIGFIADIAAHKSSTDLLGDGFAFSTCMSAMTTVPPRKASMRAVPSPSPEAPPVTMNTLPLISIACLLVELR